MKKSEIKIKALEYLHNELKNIKCKLELEAEESELVNEVIDEIKNDFTRKIENLKRLLNPGERNKLVYEYKEGVIEKFYGQSLIYREYYCKVEGETYTQSMKVLGGVFNKSTAPRVGDTVKIRCRMTKASGMRWWWHNAKICEIVKRKEETNE